MKRKFTLALTTLLLLIFIYPPLSAVGQKTLVSGSGSSGYAVPTGWDVSGTVAGGQYLRFEEGTITSPEFAPHNGLSFTYSVATYGSGTNHPLTIRILNASTNAVIKEETTATPTSSTYISTGSPISLGDIDVAFKIQMYGPKSKGVRLSNYSITGTPVSYVLMDEVDNVDLSATYGSSSSLSEGDGDAINMGTELTLSYDNVTSGYVFMSWVVTDEDDNDVTEDVLDGSTLTVPDYDIIISAIVMEVQEYTITFNAGTGSCTTTTMTGLTGETITLPAAATVTAPEGWTFAGWCNTNVSNPTTTQPTLFTGSYTIEGNATLYAVYSKKEGNGGTRNFVFKDIAEANSWTNSSPHKTIEISPITLTATGSNTLNGNYYTSDQTWRIYATGDPVGGVFVTSSLGPVTAVSSNPSQTFTISNGSATFTNNNNSGSSVAFKSISVTYDGSTTYHTSPIAMVATPTIEFAGTGTGAANTYYESATVTLDCTTDGAVIYYTTDGNEPTTSSTLYEGPFAVTTTSTIKAIAVKTNYANSEKASQELTIIHRIATFTDGVYSTLNSSTAYNEWYAITVTGDAAWGWDNNGYARIAGSGNNEAWLISPKMAVENGKLAVSFDCVGRYTIADQFEAYYSTDYPGYGIPNSYTWTEISESLPYNADSWDMTTINVDLTEMTNVFFAFKYVSTTSNSGILQVNNFTAKQCYSVTYNANGGTGTMTDSNSPYAVGATVIVPSCAFTAPAEPAGLEFIRWNTQADGRGTSYYPGTENNTFTMSASAVELFAIWAFPCSEAPTMAATTSSYTYVNESGTKSWTIDLNSSVTTVGVGGCEISEYGFVYSASNTTPTIADSKLTIAIPDGGVLAGAITAALTGVAENTTYYVRSYAINDFGTGYGDVATVTTGAFPTWIISYSTNGVAEAATTTVYQGDAISTLIAPTAANIPADFVFKGWYAEEYYNATTAPTYVEIGDAISSDKSLKAVFAKEESTPEERFLDITINNFTEITGTSGSYTTTFTHDYTNPTVTVEAYGVYKNAGIQMNTEKGTYIKNTTAMPGYITKFVLTWKSNTKNTITMYADGNSVASTSSTKVGEPEAASTQTIVITNPSTNNYKYFYMDGTTVSGACVITSFKIYYCYMGEETTSTNYCTRVCTSTLPITGYGDGTGNWYLIASPVAGSIAPDDVTNLLGTQIGENLYNYDLYRFNQIPTPDNNVYKEWQNYHQHDTYEVPFMLENGKGYLYAKKVGTTLTFNGPAAVDGEVQLNYSEANPNVNMHGWNLIGNPFGSTATLPSALSYYTLNETRTELTPGSATTIEAMEAIFVQATTTGQSVTFTKQNRNAGSNTILSLNLSSVNNGVIDRAIVRFDEGNALPKFMLNPNNTKVFIPVEGKDYAVVRSEAQGEMPVSFRANENGQYTLTVNAEGVEMNYLHLIDNMTGADIDLLATPSYTFNAKTTDYESRFRLVFAANNEDGSSTGSEAFAFISDGNIIVNGEGVMQIIDVTGRVIRSTDVARNVSTSGMPAGVYVLRLINGDSVRTQKIVVR